MFRFSLVLFSLLALSLTAGGCDSSEADPALTIEAVASGEVSEAEPIAQVSTFSLSDAAEVRLAPFRAAPSDPDLAERFRLSQNTASVLSVATGEAYSAGYYLVENRTPEVGLAFGPAGCEEDDSCLVLVQDDSRVEEDGGTGAVFFSVLDNVETGPPLRFLPFGIGGAAQLAISGSETTEAVDVPSIGTFSARFADAGSVRVVRGTSDSEVLIVLRRQGSLRTAILAEDQADRMLEAPEGSGSTEVYVVAEQ